MTPESRAELRKLAQAATPGPWEVFETGVCTEKFGDDVISHIRNHDDRAFVAAANPATVLELLDRIAELEAGEARTEWRVVDPEGYALNPMTSETVARKYLGWWPDGSHLESRTVTTSAWEAVNE